MDFHVWRLRFPGRGERVAAELGHAELLAHGGVVSPSLMSETRVPGTRRHVVETLNVRQTTLKSWFPRLTLSKGPECSHFHLRTGTDAHDSPDWNVSQPQRRRSLALSRLPHGGRTPCSSSWLSPSSWGTHS